MQGFQGAGDPLKLTGNGIVGLQTQSGSHPQNPMLVHAQRGDGAVSKAVGIAGIRLKATNLSGIRIQTVETLQGAYPNGALKAFRQARNAVVGEVVLPL